MLSSLLLLLLQRVLWSVIIDINKTKQKKTINNRREFIDIKNKIPSKQAQTFLYVRYTRMQIQFTSFQVEYYVEVLCVRRRLEKESINSFEDRSKDIKDI